jgi:hypothetical protein
MKKMELYEKVAARSKWLLFVKFVTISNDGTTRRKLEEDKQRSTRVVASTSNHGAIRAATSSSC